MKALDIVLAIVNALKDWDGTPEQGAEKLHKTIIVLMGYPPCGQPRTCPDCGHTLHENEHGIDQNDVIVDGEDNLVHSGKCTYCKICNPRPDPSEPATSETPYPRNKAEQDQVLAERASEPAASGEASRPDTWEIADEIYDIVDAIREEDSVGPGGFRQVPTLSTRQCMELIENYGRMRLAVLRTREEKLREVIEDVVDWQVQEFAGAPQSCLFCGRMKGAHDSDCISLKAQAALGKGER